LSHIPQQLSINVINDNLRINSLDKIQSLDDSSDEDLPIVRRGCYSDTEIKQRSKKVGTS
jgi:hypothetical protein